MRISRRRHESKMTSKKRTVKVDEETRNLAEEFNEVSRRSEKDSKVSGNCRPLERRVQGQ